MIVIGTEFGIAALLRLFAMVSQECPSPNRSAHLRLDDLTDATKVLNRYEVSRSSFTLSDDIQEGTKKPVETG